MAALAEQLQNRNLFAIPELKFAESIDLHMHSLYNIVEVIIWEFRELTACTDLRILESNILCIRKNENTVG